jgi:hypothetical protein
VSADPGFATCCVIPVGKGEFVAVKTPLKRCSCLSA